MLTFSDGSKSSTRDESVEPFLPGLEYRGDKVVLVCGALHLTFGIFVYLLQILSAFISWSFYNHNMFEDFHKPGVWLGTPMVTLGVICIIQRRYQDYRLNIAIWIHTLINVSISTFFIAFKVRWIIHDPEADAFRDCESPRWPKSIPWDDSPNCNAQKMNNSVGQAILAFASGEIILAFVGLVLIQMHENEKGRSTQGSGPPRYITPSSSRSSTMVRV